MRPLRLGLTSCVAATALALVLGGGCRDATDAELEARPVDQELELELGFDESMDEARRTAMVLARMHHINQLEIELGKIAMNELQGPVAEYAERVVADHRRADDMVMEVANELGLSLPEAKLPADKQEEIAGIKQRMRTAHGQALAREYLDAMKTTHGDAILVLTAAAPRVDEELVDLLEKQVPILGQHYALADLLLQREVTA